jgi:hypothetical protein
MQFYASCVEYILYICCDELSHSDISIFEGRIAEQTIATIDQYLEPQLLYFI